MRLHDLGTAVSGRRGPTNTCRNYSTCPAASATRAAIQISLHTNDPYCRNTRRPIILDRLRFVRPVPASTGHSGCRSLRWHTDANTPVTTIPAPIANHQPRGIFWTGSFSSMTVASRNSSSERTSGKDESRGEIELGRLIDGCGVVISTSEYKSTKGGIVALTV